MGRVGENDVILAKIEFLVEDFVAQLAAMDNRITIRCSSNPADHQLSFNKRTAAKLAYNLKALAQVYSLLLSGRQSTLRDLYYDQKHLYNKQENLNRSISAICELLNEPRKSINVVSSSKGLLAGAVSLLSPSGAVNCRPCPIPITESLMDTKPSSDALFILVVEKDATFQKLLDDGFFALYPRSILVTGKGYPDLCTRRVLSWLVAELRLPIFGLFDADPHGIEIFLTYKHGSIREHAEGKGAAIESIKWLGLKPSDEKLIPVAADQMLPMVHVDFVKASRVRRRAQALEETDVVFEIEALRTRRAKMELEAVSSAGASFLPRLYLAPRLRLALGAEV